MSDAVVSLDDSYDAYPKIEAAFREALDESLNPRGPEVLYGLTGSLGLPAGASVLDVGCGEGGHTIELARQFGFKVLGIDPVARHIGLGFEARQVAAATNAALASNVSFAVGRADDLPVADASVDLIWCREVLMYAPDLNRAFEEFRRVLRPGGRGLVYQEFTGPALSDAEAESFWHDLGAVASSARAEAVETAIIGVGLVIDEHIALTSEWGERAEERSSSGTRRLLHAARLLRDPHRYIEQFGETAYRIMLGDCLWHVYRMIGKLTGGAYIFSRPPA